MSSTMDGSKCWSAYRYYMYPILKATVQKAALVTDIRDDPVLGISVNNSNKALCPPPCFLFVCSECCFVWSYRLGLVEISTGRLKVGGAGLQECHRRSPISHARYV